MLAIIIVKFNYSHSVRETYYASVLGLTDTKEVPLLWIHRCLRVLSLGMCYRVA